MLIFVAVFDAVLNGVVNNFLFVFFLLGPFYIIASLTVFVAWMCRVRDLSLAEALQVVDCSNFGSNDSYVKLLT